MRIQLDLSFRGCIQSDLRRIQSGLGRIESDWGRIQLGLRVKKAIGAVDIFQWNGGVKKNPMQVLKRVNGGIEKIRRWYCVRVNAGSAGMEKVSMLALKRVNGAWLG